MTEVDYTEVAADMAQKFGQATYEASQWQSFAKALQKENQELKEELAKHSGSNED